MKIWTEFWWTTRWNFFTSSVLLQPWFRPQTEIYLTDFWRCQTDLKNSKLSLDLLEGSLLNVKHALIVWLLFWICKVHRCHCHLAEIKERKERGQSLALFDSFSPQNYSLLITYNPNVYDQIKTCIQCWVCSLTRTFHSIIKYSNVLKATCNHFTKSGVLRSNKLH